MLHTDPHRKRRVRSGRLLTGAADLGPAARLGV